MLTLWFKLYIKKAKVYQKTLMPAIFNSGLEKSFKTPQPGIIKLESHLVKGKKNKSNVPRIL